MKKVFLNVYARAESASSALHYYNRPYFIMNTTKDPQNLVVGQKKRLANLQYKYNFKGAKNTGYYWIDDIDNGEKVEIMPDTPEREGYTFGGWYTEEECENKFDFETVFNKAVLEVGETYPDDYVTYLYAKWLPNEG